MTLWSFFQTFFFSLKGGVGDFDFVRDLRIARYVEGGEAGRGGGSWKYGLDVDVEVVRFERRVGGSWKEHTWAAKAPSRRRFSTFASRVGARSGCGGSSQSKRRQRRGDGCRHGQSSGTSRGTTHQLGSYPHNFPLF